MWTTSRACCLPTAANNTEVTNESKNDDYYRDSSKEFDKEVSKLLAKRLNDLHVEERERILNDIHGVGHKEVMIENDFIVKLFNEEIDDIIKRFKSSLEMPSNTTGSTTTTATTTNNDVVDSDDIYAYELAIQMNSQYIRSKKHCLKFLYADGGNVKNAAIKMLKHYKVKLSLFGEKLLVQDIEYNHLTNEDRVSLLTGSHQILDTTDVTGRTLLYGFQQLVQPTSIKAFLRARYYLTMTVLNDNESMQRNGIIYLAFCNGWNHFFIKSLKHFKCLFDIIPIRIVAIHFFHINEKMNHEAMLLVNAISNTLQSRIRFHMEDSFTRCLYTLQSFGINPQFVPLGNNGQVQKQLFYDALETYKESERKKRLHLCCNNDDNNNNTNNTTISSTITNNATTTTTTTTTGTTPTIKTVTVNTTSVTTPPPTTTSVTPTPTTTTTTRVCIKPTINDVVLSRGISYPGNFTVQKLVEIERSAYKQASTRFEKTCIVLSIYSHIRKCGGRFLKLNKQTDEYEIVTDVEAQTSISRRFRRKS